MSSCIPRSYACGWIPNFVNGNESCVLPSYSTETRSRLTAGGVFMRSKIVGDCANEISVNCEWLDDLGNPIDYGFLIPIPTGKINIKLTISYGSYSAVFNTTQYIEGSPKIGYVDPTGSPKVQTIAFLRNLLESDSNSLITFPTIDYTTFPSTGTVENNGYIAPFNTTHMSGGTGTPCQITAPSALDNIRTGPIYTLVHIQQSEAGNSTGTLETFNKVRHYNGTCWALFDTINPDCVSGSPIICPSSVTECSV